MALPNIKELRELLKLLRSQGVLQFQSTELSLVLSENLPVAPNRAKAEEIIQEDLTPEEEAERILFYSATHPTESIPES